MARRCDIADLVSERRAADKVAPLAGWAPHHVRWNPELLGSPLHDQVQHFRQLLPGTSVGRHALSHISWTLKLHHPDRPYRPYRALVPRTPSPDPAQVLHLARTLHDAGYHAELNKRLKRAFEPPLNGRADLGAFASGRSAAAGEVILRPAYEVHLV